MQKLLLRAELRPPPSVKGWSEVCGTEMRSYHIKARLFTFRVKRKMGNPTIWPLIYPFQSIKQLAGIKQHLFLVAEKSVLVHPDVIWSLESSSPPRILTLPCSTIQRRRSIGSLNNMSINRLTTEITWDLSYVLRRRTITPKNSSGG